MHKPQLLKKRPRGAEGMAEAIKNLCAELPDLSETAARRFAYYAAGAVAVHKDAEDARDALAYLLDDARANQEPWALEYAEAHLRTILPTYQDTYQRALQVGLDPVKFLQATHDLEEDFASEVAAHLANQEDEKHLEGLAEAGEDTAADTVDEESVDAADAA